MGPVLEHGARLLCVEGKRRGGVSLEPGMHREMVRTLDGRDAVDLDESQRADERDDACAGRRQWRMRERAAFEQEPPCSLGRDRPDSGRRARHARKVLRRPPAIAAAMR